MWVVILRGVRGDGGGKRERSRWTAMVMVAAGGLDPEALEATRGRGRRWWILLRCGYSVLLLLLLLLSLLLD